MNPERGHDRAVSRRLHPRIYAALIGLTLWMVLAVWGFAGSGYTDYLLVVVSGFLLAAVALLGAAWRIRQHHRDPATPPAGTQSYRDWASGDLETWQGRLKASEATIQILLPVAAVALGMTGFAIIAHFASGGA
jgi:hypothetical protein